MTSSPTVVGQDALVIFGDRIARPVTHVFASVCEDSTRPIATPAPHNPENPLNHTHDDDTPLLYMMQGCEKHD